MILRSLIIAVLMVLSGIADCADKDKAKIAVEDQSGDDVGRRLVYDVKEKIRSSQSMELVTNGNVRCIRIVILTTDKHPEIPQWKGRATVFTAIWLSIDPNRPPFFLDAVIGYSGSDTLIESAEGIVAKTDQWVSAMPQK